MDKNEILTILLPLPKYVAIAIFVKVVLVTMMISITFDVSNSDAEIHTLRHIVEDLVWVVEGLYFWFIYLFMNKKESLIIMDIEKLSLVAFFAAIVKLCMTTLLLTTEVSNKPWLAAYYIEDILTWLAMALFFWFYRANRRKTREELEASLEE